MQQRVAYGEGKLLLVESTVRVVARAGLRGLTFRAVAEQAGVNNSLVAHHFGTRDVLLSAALEWAVEQSIESSRLFDLTTEDTFADALLDTVRERPDIQAFQYEMILEARRNPMYRDAVSRLYRRYQEVSEASLRGAGVREEDVTTLARRAFLALDGLVLSRMAGVDEADLRRALHSLYQTLLQGTAEH